MHIEIFKGYQIKPHREHPKSLIIVTDGKGGKIPSVLDGMYTTLGLAKTAIDDYLITKADNGKKSDKTVTEG